MHFPKRTIRKVLYTCVGKIAKSSQQPPSHLNKGCYFFIYINIAVLTLIENFVFLRIKQHPDNVPG